MEVHNSIHAEHLRLENQLNKIEQNLHKKYSYTYMLFSVFIKLLALIFQVCIDEANKIVTSPAFMYDAQFHQVHDGIAKMVGSVIDML